MWAMNSFLNGVTNCLILDVNLLGSPADYIFHTRDGAVPLVAHDELFPLSKKRYLVHDICLLRLVKTPKLSPLCVRTQCLAVASFFNHARLACL